MEDLPRLVYEQTDGGFQFGLRYFAWKFNHHQSLYNLDYDHFLENNSEMASASIDSTRTPTQAELKTFVGY